MGAGRRSALAALLCAALAGAVATVYAQTLGFGFVRFDDPTLVSQNPMVQRGLDLESLRWAFTRTHLLSWQPLTWLSHMLDVELYRDASGGHHATSVLLHGLNALLLFAVLRSLTGSLYRSALVAALFAVHPLHVESVAWVSERKDVLSTVFGLGAIGAYGAWARRGGAVRYAGVLLLFAASLMSKPMWVTLPCVLLLLDAWPLGRLRRDTLARRVGEKAPLFAMSAASSALTWVIQYRGGAVVAAYAHLPLRASLENAVVAYALYLRRLVWPDDLSVLYPHPSIPVVGGEPLSTLEVAGSALLLIGISLVLLGPRGRPYARVGWLWFLGALVPVIGLVQVGVQAMADRYAYLPAIGIYIVCVWGAGECVERLASRVAWLRPVAAAAACAVVAALVAAAHTQAGVWRDSRTLFENALARNPRNATAHHNLANELYARGDVTRAIEHYRAATLINPYYGVAFESLGDALAGTGDVDAALEPYRRALEIRPEAVRIWQKIGNALVQQGRLDEAGDAYAAALRRRPDFAEAHAALAEIAVVRGRFDDAEAHYRAALEHAPGLVELMLKLGNVLRAQGEREQALAWYRRFLEARPESALGRHLLADALRNAGPSGAGASRDGRATPRGGDPSPVSPPRRP